MINDGFFQKLDEMNVFLNLNANKHVPNISIIQFNRDLFNYLFSSDDSIKKWIDMQNKRKKLMLKDYMNNPLSITIYQYITAYSKQLEERIDLYEKNFPQLSSDKEINKKIALKCLPYLIKGDYNIDAWWDKVETKIDGLKTTLHQDARCLIDFYHYDHASIITGNCLGLYGRIGDLLNPKQVY